MEAINMFTMAAPQTMCLIGLFVAFLAGMILIK